MSRYFAKWGLAPVALGFALCASGGATAADTSSQHGERTLNVLFIGNSYTGRHNLARIVQALAEFGSPGLRFHSEQVVYGGRTLECHWDFKSQNWIRVADLTAKEQQRTVEEFERRVAALESKETTMTAEQLRDSHRLPVALVRHRALLDYLSQKPPRWDIVILQSYMDTKNGLDSPYAQYARKFAEVAHSQGARVILYVTTPDTQNANPLEQAPDPAPAIAEARVWAQLGKEIDADVVPMIFIANRCLTARPDVTLRFVNDGHLNQTMAYLTACSIHSVLFDKSPEGLPVNSVTDGKKKDAEHPDVGPDGDPLTKVFADDMRLFLQKTAWEGIQAYKALGGKD
jgi:hypothetical protein